METGEIRKQIDLAIAARDAAQAAKMLTAAWAREPGAGLAGFVASRFDRIRDGLALSPHRWAILRSFTVEPVVPMLRAIAYTRGIALEIQTSRQQTLRDGVIGLDIEEAGREQCFRSHCG